MTRCHNPRPPRSVITTVHTEVPKVFESQVVSLERGRRAAPMSTINKLSIQGIRSFSPDDPQVIAFRKPLTLIVGSNGSGKTTIIECIKMALTGELPPDANRGKNFVHDPKVQANTETKAAIRMQFQTVNGKVCRPRAPPSALACTRSASPPRTPRISPHVEVHSRASVHAAVQDAEGGRRAELQHDLHHPLHRR